MTRWDELIGENASVLRDVFCRAASTAHTENGDRFAPDDLGDDARIYGITTSNSARFLAGQDLESRALNGVAVCERGLVWWVQIDRAPLAPVQIYFYKAPPGATKIEELRLDDADVKRQLSRSNARQLDLFNRSGAPGHPDLLNLIIVHYGDPVAGPGKLEVGAPYIDGNQMIWEWQERFDQVDEQANPAIEICPLGDDDGVFEGLRLVEPLKEDAQDAAASNPPSEGQRFKDVQMRDDLLDGDQDEGTGQEPS
ncbi:MAG: hypothetical protein ACLP0J_13035 [Solirubrobacteraceae bacterium]